ncbi:MAG: TonB-dependent receptor [Bacteroidales bacterium]|nr:TonB-dependent receptor [Bacteroidales bacterium]
MRNKRLSRIALALLSTMVSMATLHALGPASVSGRVLDGDGNPMVGVSVSAQGTTAATVTDTDGGFRLDVPSGTKTLNVSMLGLRSVEVPLAETTTWYEVTMAEDPQTLRESVAVGYGTLGRGEISSSIATVCGETLTERASAFNVTQALAGKVAGYSVHNTSGRPGGSNTVYVRGRGNNGVDASPLYVVDGIAGVDIDMLNPADIESVTVLKDAASTAIFGASGANGVVIVTTKTGKDKDGSLTYSGSVGLNQFTNGYKELEDIYENAISHGHNLSFSKANERNSVYASLGYKSFGGIVPKTDVDNLSAALNFQSKINDWLDVRFGADFSTRTQSRGDLVFDDMAYKSVSTDGVSGGQDRLAIPVGYDFVTMLDKAAYRQKDQQVLLNGAGDIHLSKDLTLTVRGDYRTSNYTFGQSAPGGIAGATVADNGFANISNADTHRWSNEDYLTYGKEFGDVKTTSVLGVSFSGFNFENSYSGSTDFSDNQYEFYRMQAGTDYDQSTSGYDKRTTKSVFFRTNWAVSSRYLFGVTLRYDSASIYGFDNMSGIYPALSAGWVISEEPWFDSARDAVNLFKVRASYGIVGNSALPLGVGNAGLGNNLLWEESSQLDLGLDLSFWGNRLNVSADFYNNDTKDPLLKRVVPLADGLVSQYSNLGRIRNTGLDVTINARPVAGRDFNWDATLLYSLNKSKAVEIGGKVAYPFSPVSSVEGEELNTLLGLGGTTPAHEFDFVNSFSLKGFTLLVDLTAKAGFWTFCDAWNTKYSADLLGGSFQESFAYKGNYLRLRNIALTYDFGRDVLGNSGFIRSLRLGVQAENVFTSSDVPSIDPEDFIWDAKYGVSGGAYPRPMTISGTLRLSF